MMVVVILRCRISTRPTRSTKDSLYQVGRLQRRVRGRPEPRAPAQRLGGAAQDRGGQQPPQAPPERLGEVDH